MPAITTGAAARLGNGEPTYFPPTTCPHLQALPVAEHEAGGGGAAGPPPQLIGKAKGCLRRQVGVHGEQVAALPHLLLQKKIR